MVARLLELYACYVCLMNIFVSHGNVSFVFTNLQAFGYLDQDNVSGPWNGPEQYTMYSYLSGDSHLGQYWVFASKYGGSDVSWRLTAVDGYGDVLLQEEGEFVDGCGGQTLSVFNFYLARYLDNGCDVADMAAVSVVENRSPKAETGNA